MSKASKISQINNAINKKNKIELVIIGNGMVGHRFVELLIDKKLLSKYSVTILAQEPRKAYDRIHLSSYFTGHTAEDLSLVREGLYEENGINIFLGERAILINRLRKEIHTQTGRIISYDKLILATGSYPWLPPIKGANGNKCFVYRTIEDLDAIKECAKNSKTGAVIGGGLLGLEAAEALKNSGIKTHIIEYKSTLMVEQLDATGGEQLQRKIENLNVSVHTNKNTLEITDVAQGKILHFADGTKLEVDFVVVSTGICPHDELGKLCDLKISPKSGIVINDYCQTSDADIYAIGECASWREQIFGLVAPGYKMAQVALSHLINEHQTFNGADTSTKLKFMGIDVGSIGDSKGLTPHCRSYVYLDENKAIYKRLVVSSDNKKLLGAVLVGDTSDYNNLLQLKLNNIDLPNNPDSLILPAHTAVKKALGVEVLPASAQICSCYDVSKEKIISAINSGCHTVAAIKAQTKAGTGCGGCVPLVTQILGSELSKQGITVSKDLCAHFKYSRQELFHLIKTKQLKTFADVLAKYGQGYGCEICKPTIGSILASVWNEYVLKPELVALQDSNDIFLANIQKNGTYSVIPRSAGGEITPEGLIAIGKIAQKYNLYCKITGSQRIGLFGAQKDDLPNIWQQLIAAGFESGHAYAKALRMAKTCVGSSWCRFGVGDSVSLGVELENRYKGIRAPHKFKLGVSGCTRECAEAQSKDVGIIATEKGWNLYVCGNGGMKPRHADLLASNLNKDTLIKYIDRFLMFYIQTADKLQRTATWLESLDGGIKYLKSIIIDDKLGINAHLEEEMTRIRLLAIDEWQIAVNNQNQDKRFSHFINSDKRDETVQFVPERNQHRPKPYLASKLANKGA